MGPQNTPPPLNTQMQPKMGLLRSFLGFRPPFPPHLGFANALPYNCGCLIRAISPPPTTTLDCCLTQQTQNRTMAAPFQVFGPQPPPLPWVCKRNTLQPMLLRMSHPTISFHCQLSPPPDIVCQNRAPPLGFCGGIKPLHPLRARSTNHLYHPHCTKPHSIESSPINVVSPLHIVPQNRAPLLNFVQATQSPHPPFARTLLTTTITSTPPNPTPIGHPPLK